MIISMDAKKAFDRIHLFMMKTLRKLGIETAFPKAIKVIYENIIVTIILKGEKLEVFPLRFLTGYGYRLP